MKATYFYSEKQRQVVLSIDPDRNVNYINGKEYTEVQTHEETAENPHKSNWDDAIIVHVNENCPLDWLQSKLFGTKHAKTI